MIEDWRSYRHFHPTGTASMPRPLPANAAPGRPRGAWVLLALCLSGPAAPAVVSSAGREAMADAMSRMMSAMGLLGQSAAGASAAAGAAAPALGAVPGALPGAAPGAPAGATPWGQAGEAGQRLLDQAARAVPDGALAGLWEASGGGLLIVEGGHFRLYAPDGGFVDGDLEVSGSRVRMVSRRAGFALDFESALDQGRLALRDARGQVFLYRRLVLTGGD